MLVAWQAGTVWQALQTADSVGVVGRPHLGLNQPVTDVKSVWARPLKSSRRIPSSSSLFSSTANQSSCSSTRPKKRASPSNQSRPASKHQASLAIHSDSTNLIPIRRPTPANSPSGASLRCDATRLKRPNPLCLHLGPRSGPATRLSLRPFLAAEPAAATLTVTALRRLQLRLRLRGAPPQHSGTPQTPKKRACFPVLHHNRHHSPLPLWSALS